MNAAYYHKAEDGCLRCELCPHDCLIAEGHSGLCGARTHKDGRLLAETYGCVSSFGLDPIEKKPLYHFFPGKLILSIGNYGCNLRCMFCQNHGISMTARSENAEMLTPAQVAALADRMKPEGNIGVAYTYNEPLIGYEFVRDCAIAVHEKGLKNVLVTNGYLHAEPFLALLPYIDALNIDLKGFTEAFYRRVKGGLEEVKRNIALAADHAHVEVTTLIIPGENDSEAEIEALSRFLAGINPEMPLHLTRFFPNHEMTDKPPTPKETIFRLKEVAEQYLKYVHPGNMR